MPGRAGGVGGERGIGGGGDPTPGENGGVGESDGGGGDGEGSPDPSSASCRVASALALSSDGSWAPTSVKREPRAHATARPRITTRSMVPVATSRRARDRSKLEPSNQGDLSSWKNLLFCCHVLYTFLKVSYSPHALQQRRAGGHGTSLILREDPGSLPFALILLPERKKVPASYTTPLA